MRKVSIFNKKTSSIVWLTKELFIGKQQPKAPCFLEILPGRFLLPGNPLPPLSDLPPPPEPRSQTMTSDKDIYFMINLISQHQLNELHSSDCHIKSICFPIKLVYAAQHLVPPINFTAHWCQHVRNMLGHWKPRHTYLNQTDIETLLWLDTFTLLGSVTHHIRLQI